MSQTQTSYVIAFDGKIPLELAESPSSWWDILLQNLPFLITILIVVAAATVTYFSNRSAVASQNSLAEKSRKDEHENKVSEFRHQWLQEVRETGSQLCQVVHELHFLSVRRNIAVENKSDAANHGDDPAFERFEQEIENVFGPLTEKRSQYYRLASKLKMLFKQNEPETKRLFEVLDGVKKDVYDFNTMTLKDEKIEVIVEELQKILKTEWEVTKSRTWSKALNK
ncbi:hypothetical protein CLH62_20465 [Marinobacter guineae]|uniref:Uncharacterized protein n=1 Tax=Marinobacter guineae TaxID=432303 RepID=A0A2G1VA86_9GAMM|nr:hypothetical protein [Marinobacter guineae]PHQ23654.1 hypothetical protein CLH62_20465 [Marinobacter guineae]